MEPEPAWRAAAPWHARCAGSERVSLRSRSRLASQRARRANAPWHARRAGSVRVRLRSRSRSASEQQSQRARRLDGDSRFASEPPFSLWTFSACQHQTGGVRLRSKSRRSASEQSCQRARRVDTGASSASALPSQRARRVDTGGSSASGVWVDTGSPASGRTSRRARRVDTDRSSVSLQRPFQRARKVDPSASWQSSQHARRVCAPGLQSIRAAGVIQSVSEQPSQSATEASSEAISEFYRALPRVQSATTRRRRRRTTSSMSVNPTSKSVSLERAASSQTSRHANRFSSGPPQAASELPSQGVVRTNIGNPISASVQPSHHANRELIQKMQQALLDAGLNELLDNQRWHFNTILSMNGQTMHAITFDLVSCHLHNGLALPQCHDSAADQVHGWVIYHGTKNPAGILRSLGVMRTGRHKTNSNGWSCSRDPFLARKYAAGFDGFRCVVELLAKCVVRSKGTRWHYVPRNCMRYAVQAFHFVPESDSVGVDRL